VNVDFNDRIIKKFYNDFNPISDLISVNNLMGWSYSIYKDFTLGKKTKRNMGGAGKLRNKIACPNHSDHLQSILTDKFQYAVLIGVWRQLWAI
jgi:hypothetical protein